MLRDNTLKSRLAKGQPCLGAWLFSESPVAAEIFGHVGYDFVMIDHEHGFGGLPDAVRQMQALQAFPPTQLMRVPWNDPVYIKRALDSGAEGVMIPFVQNAQEAAAAVEACMYPPAGIRGCAASAVRTSNFGLDSAEYIAKANGNLVIMLQIETEASISSIPEIAKVEGIDCLFIGPTDLSASIGKPMQYDDPEVKALLERAEKTVKDAGMKMGAVPHSGLDFQGLFDRGYDLVCGGSDIGHLRQGALGQVQAHRSKNG